jgi:rare lipoprotein A
LRPVFRLRAFRVAQLTMPLTLLALPASAFAFAGTTSSDTDRPAPLPVHVTPRHVRLGRPVTVSGQASRAQAGRSVQLQSASSGRRRWHRLGSTRVGSRGGYAFHVRLRHSGVLRAVELAGDREPRARGVGGASLTPTATGSHARAVSRVAAVAVQARLRVPATERDVVAGRSVTVAGQLLPGRGGRHVAVQALVAHGWRTLARSRTGRRGGFAVSVRTPRAGERHLRVRFAGDRENSRTTAGAGGLSLLEPVLASWYEDGGSTACGFHAVDGVANRTLPCGTKVRISHGGHTVTATVDDRGPYVDGREYDLNQNTAAALGFAGVGIVYVSVR